MARQAQEESRRKSRFSEEQIVASLEVFRVCSSQLAGTTNSTDWTGVNPGGRLIGNQAGCVRLARQPTAGHERATGVDMDRKIERALTRLKRLENEDFPRDR
jgi:hypothetical protein